MLIFIAHIVKLTSNVLTP